MQERGRTLRTFAIEWLGTPGVKPCVASHGLTPVLVEDTSIGQEDAFTDAGA
eukprot:CAMPEP_0115349306 /NCGR_PEP_ID=MMETSP0270-20121206/95854_1 /TAXON_ID=71861 /ORGANISM="Scrippsiella trochoidea, Strain CCMP3099" /LENGTH=51 /DNA_ID=CAMNT_0002771307 /DNA_START=127 /DNA_END=278 /DNA_ORIENTATION=+